MRDSKNDNSGLTFTTSWDASNVFVPYPSKMRLTTFEGRRCLEGFERIGLSLIDIRIFGDIDDLNVLDAGVAVGHATISQSSDGKKCERTISIEHVAGMQPDTQSLGVVFQRVATKKSLPNRVYEIRFCSGMVSVVGEKRTRLSAANDSSPRQIAA